MPATKMPIKRLSPSKLLEHLKGKDLGARRQPNAARAIMEDPYLKPREKMDLLNLLRGGRVRIRTHKRQK